MTCKELTELITDYLEGKLAFWDRVRLQWHIGLCAACRAYLRQMRQTIRTLGMLPEEPIPPAVRDELLERFRDWKQARGKPAERSS
ncbi:MAG: zf-HC2 domain-containing protein [Nitrospirota bacterium]